MPLVDVLDLDSGLGLGYIELDTFPEGAIPSAGDVICFADTANGNAPKTYYRVVGREYVVLMVEEEGGVPTSEVRSWRLLVEPGYPHGQSAG